jgi:hypothetical protein
MNKKMFAQGVIKYRWPIVILLPIFIITVFALNIKNAAVETDWKIWFDESSPIIKNFEHFKKTFGSDDRLMIALHNEKGVFRKDILQSIQKITQALWETKSIARVDSITNYQYVHVNPEDKDEIIVEDFLQEISSLNQQQLEQKKKIATTDVQTKNLLISEDGKSAVILARMVYSAHLKPKDYIALYKNAGKIIEQYKIEDVQYYNIGVPAYTNAFMNAMGSNAKIFLPTILITVILLLGIIFRNIWSIILPLSVIILTILFIAGFTFGLGYKLNTITSMFPVFILAIGIADSIHIFWVWKHKRQEGMDNEQSILFTIEKNFTPALITSLTTFAGFISLAVSSIIPLQAFGLLLASGALTAFLLSIVLLPALFSVINPKIKIKEKKTIKLREYIHQYVDFIVRNDKKIFAVSIFFTLVCIVGIKDLNIDTEFAKQFDESTQIRKDADFVEKNIGGTISVEIIIDSKEKSGIYDPKLLKNVDEFNKAFMQKYARVRHIKSLTQVVKRYNELMNGGDKSFYKIPDSRKLISQYMLLYSLSLPQGMGINDMMDVDSRYLRITAMINIASEAQKLQMYAWTKNWWKTHSNYTATIEGLTMISAHMRMELTDTMIKSISLALALVTLIFWITFKSKFFMLISIFPNIAPLLIGLGLTGWFGINLDLGMAIVFVVIIGIAIDDTVHFLSKYKSAVNKGKNYKSAIEESLLLSGNAIIITTVILVMGFGTFLLSDFAFYSNFGLLSSISLSLAVLFDLVLLPAIISMTRKDKSERV